jgi:tetratricopeptide (TPR) repeat protein
MFAEQIFGVFVVACLGNKQRRNAGAIIYRRCISLLCVGTGAAMLLLCSQQALSQAEEEEKWIARLISVEGAVEGRRAQQADWSPAALNDEFEVGDAVRVQAFSRAAIKLPDETILRLDQNTTIFFAEPQDEKRSWLELLRGVIHVISRDPRALKVITPFANAGLEGTEFLVMVTPQETTVIVFEGGVAVSNAAGEVNVSSGQSVTARTGQLPVARVSVRPRDAVQWTLYYPPLLGYELPAADEEPGPARINDPRFYTGRASQRLAVGSIDEARDDLSQALAIDSSNVDALALQSIIELTQNDKIEALQLANQAVAQDPRSAAALIALSFAQQAHFDISGALATLQDAVDRNPGHALAWSRLSELWLAVGDLDEAENAAEKAVSINPRVAHTQAVLGFALLTRIKIGRAVAAFEKAIEFDEAAPLPRLGLGLALIRKGNLAAGLEQIEIAVILDPGNALIRSYMGKAYYEEKRDELAESQYEIAKILDPLDPTPWFYNGILKQTQNRPIEAFEEIQESIEKNDNRAIYRSQDMLRQDLAERGAAVARVYADLGFGQLAQIEGARSLGSDPASASAHRFVADSYLGAPRHEVARLSELLQSQLWQPLNLQPLQPQLGETDLFIPRGVAASAGSLAEFNPLFVHDGMWAQTDLAAGSNNTLGGDVVVAGLKGPVSFSAGAFHYETDGFRPNNDHTQDFANAFIQIALQPETMLQAEVRSRRDDRGDLPLRFDPAQFSTAFRRQTDVDTYRLGFRHDLSVRSSVIVSLLHQRTEGTQHEFRTIPPAPFPGDLTIDNQFLQDADLAEVQNVFRYGPTQFASGLGYFQSHNQSSGQAVSQIFLPFFPFVITGATPLDLDLELEHSNGYVYSQTRVGDRVTAVIGLSADKVNAPQADITQLNPKLGLTWNVGHGLTLRAAGFGVLSRDLVNNQTIEPTQVAGFNQFFDDPVGTDATSYGIGLDEAFSRRLFAGAQAVQRDLTIPYFAGSTSNRALADAEERLGRAYLYWAALDRLALRTEYYYDWRERSADIVPSGYGYTDLTTQWGLAGMTWLVSDSWSLFANVTLTDQRGSFRNTLTAVTTQGNDQFWLTDVEARWRIPQRHGFVGAGVRNLFDQSFQFHEPDAGNPTFYPGRFFYARLNLKL